MLIGIVGSEAAKFTQTTEAAAKEIIRSHLGLELGLKVVSGGCHLGGIDLWAEEIGRDVCATWPLVYLPERRSWDGGYKQRNIEIAKKSDVVHCITVKELPDSYSGMKFKSCYHCNTDDHVKSGGCWTALYAKKLGKPAFRWVIAADGTWEHSEY